MRDDGSGVLRAPQWREINKTKWQNKSGKTTSWPSVKSPQLVQLEQQQ